MVDGEGLKVDEMNRMERRRCSAGRAILSFSFSVTLGVRGEKREEKRREKRKEKSVERLRLDELDPARAALSSVQRCGI